MHAVSTLIYAMHKYYQWKQINGYDHIIPHPCAISSLELINQAFSRCMFNNVDYNQYQQCTLLPDHTRDKKHCHSAISRKEKNPDTS